MSVKTCFCSLLACSAMLTCTARATEARSWVISWWTLGVNTTEADCPKGLNPPMEKVYRRALIEDLRMSEEQADKILAGRDTSSAETTKTLVYRGRINGQPVNAYTNPMAVPEKPQFFSEGPYAVGFNLDGSEQSSFEDPETHERGVDNQYARAVGCYLGHRAFPPARSTYWEYVWSVLRDSMPAWIITMDENTGSPGEVMVTVARALEHVKKDANGDVRRDLTFRIDPASATRNVYKAKRVGSTVTLEGEELWLMGDPFLVARMHLMKPRMRFEIKPDGSLVGAVGGYQPWLDIYYMYAGSGWSGESMIGFDIPGMYHALRRHADWDPSPQAAQKSAISTGYRIEAVPAFVVGGTPSDAKEAVNLISMQP